MQFTDTTKNPSWHGLRARSGLARAWRAGGLVNTRRVPGGPADQSPAA